MSVMRAMAGLSVFACVLTIGCSDQRGSSEGMNRIQTRAQRPRAEAPKAQAASVSPEWFDKHERMRRALEGLSFGTGLVEVDPRLADELIAQLEGVVAGDRTSGGFAHLQVNQPIEAMKSFKEAILLNTDAPDAYRGLADALIFKGKVVEAGASLRTALDLEPMSAQMHFDLGMVFVRLGDRAAAIDAFQSALEIDLNHVEAHVRLAIVLYYEGDLDGAWDHVHAAAALGQAAPPQFIALLEKEGDGAEG